MHAEAILFDYGGTLDGAASHWLDRMLELYREAGVEQPFERVKTAFYRADVAAYADPIPGASLASSVDVRPESSTVRYAHPSFTVDATWFVPLDAEGGVVLLDVDTSEPITVVVRFRIDLKPMWPAALGGQNSYWDDSIKAYVAGEGSRAQLGPQRQHFLDLSEEGHAARREHGTARRQP